MTYPFFVAPYPDATSSSPILGAAERAILTKMVRKPGHVLSATELAAGIPTPGPTPTPRRMADYITTIRAALEPDATVVDVPRRGWRYVPAT